MQKAYAIKLGLLKVSFANTRPFSRLKIRPLEDVRVTVVSRRANQEFYAAISSEGSVWNTPKYGRCSSNIWVVD